MSLTLYRERLCINQVRSFLSMRGMLLGYSFKPGPKSLALGMTISYDHQSKQMLSLEKPVAREKTSLT